MIIVTGGCGFIGSHLVNRLNFEGYTDLLIVDNLKSSEKYLNLVGAEFSDIVSKDGFYRAIDDGRFDRGSIEAIFHQGACTDTMEYDGAYMMHNNYELSKKLLHFALMREVRFIYASTATVYGRSSAAIEEPTYEQPLNVYGFSKLAFDNYVRRVALHSANTVVGLRYFNVYGPGEQRKGKMASMMYQFARQIQTSGVAKVFGSVCGRGPGEQRRDFVTVSDIVRCNMHFFHGEPSTSVVNVGSGSTVSWNELVSLVIQCLGSGRIEYVEFPDSLKDKYQFETKADLTLLRKLGYREPMTSAATGIPNYLAWLLQHDEAFASSGGTV